MNITLMDMQSKIVTVNMIQRHFAQDVDSWRSKSKKRLDTKAKIYIITTKAIAKDMPNNQKNSTTCESKAPAKNKMVIMIVKAIIKTQ